MKRTSLLFLILTIFVSPTASAGLIFTFDQANYIVQPGATVETQIFLTQTNPDTVLTTDGLFSGGVRVFFNDTPPTDPATVLSLADIQPSAAFDDLLLGPDLSLDPGISAGFVDSVADPFAPITGNSLLLGTLTFTAGNVPGEVTYLRATDFDPFTDDLISGWGIALDAQITDGFATITTSAITNSTVPEPSSALIFGFAIACLAFRRFRRKFESCAHLRSVA
ncbi:hypothetical protein Enr13x_73660 [Stieleria neptunia]|uniref:Ice-binding protein C-terminal domain-containing protein n=1 Tax=Stieleria neptunia TaxID=2527979 RepID=A0A518I362_9BACT|nr:PEP-CTERM sorting domain-containing protein [Stieleria neptunia]QDV47457.1 hypothetical protein Enr13x_73660 [Stieleria neptunia]